MCLSALVMATEATTVEVDDIREIFRHVAPYIIRQWKEVCRKLGLQELELAKLEASEYHSSQAHLAFKGLCLWYDHVGKAATKDKFASALKQCGLHRAEEEIERLELRKLKVSTCSIQPSTRQRSASLSRQPSPSRQSSPSRRRQMNGQIEQNGNHVKSSKMSDICLPPINKYVDGCISRPPTRNRSASSSRRISSSRGRLVYQATNHCELCLKISVTQINPVKEVTGLWREKFKEMSEHYYEAILTNPEIFMTALENAIDNREISVLDIRGENLLVRLKLLTLGALESLNQMYKTRRLLAICQGVFVTENALKTIAAKNIGIKVELSTDILDQCREFFLTRKFKEIIHPTDTLATPSFESQPCLDTTTEDATHAHGIFNEKWRNKTIEDIKKIQERHSLFDETMDEYIRTLNILMPKDKTQIQSLSDLLQLYSYLNKTYGVSSGLRVDLFREYLLIVNNIRLIVDEIKKKLVNVAENDNNEFDDIDDLSIVKCLVDDLEHMLQPDTLFEEDLSVLSRGLNPSEKPFSGLICLVPLLLAKLSTVLFTLSPSVCEPAILSE